MSLRQHKTVVVRQRRPVWVVEEKPSEHEGRGKLDRGKGGRGVTRARLRGHGDNVVPDQFRQFLKIACCFPGHGISPFPGIYPIICYISPVPDGRQGRGRCVFLTGFFYRFRGAPALFTCNLRRSAPSYRSREERMRIACVRPQQKKQKRCVQLIHN